MTSGPATNSTDIELALESPRSVSVQELIQESDAYQRTLYPPDSTFLLDLDALAAPDVRFLVARRAGVAVGCGALRVDPQGYGEVKRMFVVQTSRGLKIGKRILERLEEQARQEGLALLRLETGVHQPEAIGLYRRSGFVECEAFGSYRPDPLCVFMEKSL